MKKLTTDEFIKRAKDIHNNKYDYSLVNYKNCREKVKIICPIHGEFEQTPQNHLKGQGCPRCSGRKKTADDFIKKAKQVHGDKYDYSKVEYINQIKKVKIICPEHGEFEQSPKYRIGKKMGCPKCHSSHGENQIRNFLKDNQFFLKSKNALTIWENYHMIFIFLQKIF